MDLRRRITFSLLLLLSASASAQEGARGRRADPQEKKAPKDPLTAAARDSARLDPAHIAERRAEAERLPLFRGTEVLPFTLVANFKAIARQRDTLSKQRFTGALIVAADDGTPDTIPVELQSRGHFRLAKCSFVPVRVHFTKKKGARKTPFDGQKSLKLGVHCQNGNREFEQVVLREHLAYRAHNLVTPSSYRTRLSRATYVDSATGHVVDTRYALWIENDDDMAARMGGIERELRSAMYDDVDLAAALRMALFEFLISNHDWSMYALHNVRMVYRPDGSLHPVPYDFDFSGLVNARYAAPPPTLNLRTVRERLYRGPCVQPEVMVGALAEFRAQKAAILALPAAIPDLDPRTADDAREFLGEFFRIAERSGDIKAELLDTCAKKGTA